MTQASPPPAADRVEPIDLKDALEERYLAYALSTIMGRALPDARDGLKPVHRRILYGMRLLRLDPGTPFKKSAKIVGDVMGGFHPHGDAAIYDALVRLAQDFSSRYPLVDGQGNFGNVDGDGAAAYRYTEARLTEVARLLLDGLDEDACDFRPNYDGSGSEPVVLPSALPHLLANGAQGIAVGMATSVPPHNAAELLDAALVLLDRPEAGNDEVLDAVLEHVQGPDFPTGGVLIEPRAAIREAYRTGRGAFRLRARWVKEETSRGGWVAVVTEVPFLVPKARLVERIAELIETKKAPLLADVRDESAEDVRLVLEPRARNVDPALFMESLFKLTELEVRIPLNMNVLVGGRTPRVLSLPEALRAWLDHRREVLGRRSRHRLAEVARRMEVLGGLLVAFLNLDEVIRIIREEDDPKRSLMHRFTITGLQADAILDTRLRALRRLEEEALRRENEALEAERAKLDALLASDGLQRKALAAEMRKVRKTLGPDTPLGARRTTLADAPEPGEIDLIHALVEREPVTVVVSRRGWIKALKGHGLDRAGFAFKEGDALLAAFETETTAKVLVLASDGKVYTLEASRLPGGRGFGDPLKVLVDVGEGAEVVTALPHRPGAKLLLAGSDGRGFVAPADELVAVTRKGRAALTLEAGARAAAMIEVRGDGIATIGENRRLLVFPIAQVPEMARGKGARLQRFKEGALADVTTLDLAAGLSWPDGGGRTRHVPAAELAEWVGARGDIGRLPPRGFPRSNRFAG